MKEIRNPLACVVALVLVVCVSATSRADDKGPTGNSAADGKSSDKTAADEVDVTAMATLTVVLRDAQGAAIANAEVRPYAMRMRERDGHGYWDQKVYGPPKTAISNEKGEAVIQYPGHVRSGPNVLTTSLVTFSVTHTDFVKKTVHFGLGPQIGAQKATVSLDAGCEVDLSAVGEDRQRITGFGVLMAGPYGPDLWAEGGEESRRSRSIKEGIWQTILVKPQKDGPTLFSNLLPLRVGPSQTVRFRNIPMRPGTKVHGKFAENVPRPVKGYVVATSVPSPAKNSWEETEPSLLWHDWVEVTPEGTFEFESLPRSGELQLIAICEGWISSTVSDEPVAAALVAGQVFPIELDEHSFVVEMEPTGTLEVALVSEDGKPFTEGRVGSSPNQHYLKGGNTSLGQRYRSVHRIGNQLLPPDARTAYPYDELQLPYIREVGPDGMATLKGLPIGRPEYLFFSHPGFVLKGGGQHGLDLKLDSAEPITQKVVVIPAGK